ncbi:GNAT family N-acetyltransferase [Oleiharenicola sp. Vm1]|uniref:GNAT family N-acetyltransferase n=1 Tax=Oleiharenicola sp. Vm1 TaxID=3398393 RepID=UPI0039F486F1
MPFPAEFPLIETPRLVLRALDLTDAPAVQRLAGAREVAQATALIPHPYPDGVAEQWIATHAAEWAAHRGLSLAVTLKPTGELIGAIGLTFATAHARAELGYWIGVPFWRHGFATEAATALTDFGFRVLGLNRVQAHHYASNPASGRVLLKVGMRREGTSPRMMRKNERFEDVVFYGVLRRDWPGLGSAALFAPG